MLQIIINPNLTFFKILRPALIGEIARKLGRSEEEVKEALDNNIYTRGAGGNYPRNVAMSPLSGVEKDEAFDVTPYAVAVGSYFLERITTYKLPRKLKVSFSSGKEDAAHCTVQDLGFVAVKEGDKELYNELNLLFH